MKEEVACIYSLPKTVFTVAAQDEKRGKNTDDLLGGDGTIKMDSF